MVIEANDLINAKVTYCEFFPEGRHSQLYESRLYYKFQSAMQDAIDGNPELWENVPEELRPKEFDKPLITYGGVDPKTNFTTDFELRYILSEKPLRMIVVWIGTVIIEDEEKRRR